jgi:metallophosphoesterase superfamily enzyme
VDPLIRLLTPWPAMLVETGERILMASDFHLGIEYELAKMGINIPYQTERYMEELLGLVREHGEHGPDRVILLGDVKHGVPITSFQEKREIPLLFNALLDEVDRVDVARGNHDGNIQNLAPEEVEIHPSKGFMVGEAFKVGVLHGHSWPYPALLGADLLVMGHNHPTVRLNTPLGVRVTRRAWVRGHVDPERVASAILGQDGVKFEGDAVKAFQKEYDVRVGKPQVVIMPTFNDLMGGLPVNSETPKSLLGPLFRSGAIEVDDFDVYLLDGTFLGRVDFLRTLS